MQLKIGIAGTGIINEESKKAAEKAFQLGKLIVEKGHQLVTGAGLGLPYEAAKGAKSVGGKIIGVSPGKDKEDHLAHGFHLEPFDELIFTGRGIPARNFDFVALCDVLIATSGSSGTLSEIAFAFALGKKLGILTDTGGISNHVKLILDKCENRKNAKIVYDDDISSLLNKLINL